MQLLKKFISLLLIGLTLAGFGSALEAQAGIKLPSTVLDFARTIQIQTISLDRLPPEAQKTINLIKKGGPFPYEQDGAIFGNRERILPEAPRGYYREYTVRTPGSFDRGARRIVTGENGELYYTNNHYKSFFRVRVK
ncbi:guanyl-specific ribonuclease Sa [Kovacikia minuta CCNUW1]|uniref:ribonuclease domain-containing protein n=1 Tax=Kovacikia minuta TaxID=2931930 RepID=UPI001CC93314|nr:ribonuclease domain-containing protein [Kovacikia minuta]UBF24963.1 guanyl-specific ribonuclease Sa [Kovacikia minuta CCNUW1]